MPEEGEEGEEGEGEEGEREGSKDVTLRILVTYINEGSVNVVRARRVVLQGEHHTRVVICNQQKRETGVSLAPHMLCSCSAHALLVLGDRGMGVRVWLTGSE